ncbi:nucleotide-binding universal stress UspA family protein [Rhodovulum iodosum]|uniref:Nucleotide-binding universal stress UspA family protein n=1 Tax=Rhodovulum iodosum TaxID=68291 RepID=A0ABV3XTJ3_9RHOB|nr:universal stress protein [Rhodovulum robiginosum]RSK32106.1 universal stress protein [Rhodovulum robiginosum]
MQKILLATDFSERSDRALRRAILLARQFGSSVSAVHVVDDDQPRRIVDSERDAASALLDELRHTVQNVDGIACETRVVLADPFAGIARAAEEEAPDLLVVGPHRRQALRDVFVGTTAERTIRSAACPVLMVNAPPVGSYRHVMLTTDLSEGAAQAAKASVVRDIAHGANASILHVFDAPAIHLAMSHTIPTDGREAYLEDQRKEASRALSAFVKSVDWRSIRQMVRQVRNAPAEEILSAARDDSADLVVIGTHGRSGLARFFLGSVAEAVLRSADRDVLAVPPSQPV